jgi:hypothetical protein
MIWQGLCAAGMAALLGLSGRPTAAAEALASPAVAAEVDDLLLNLARSGCRFERNGRWYGADEARAHLMMKWQELQRRRLAQSTERFIELAASKSMLSGLPYQVQCGTSTAKPSAIWLRQQLQALRAASPRTP